MARTSFVDVALRLRGANRFRAEVAAASQQLDDMGVRGAKALGGFAQKADRFKSAGRSLTTGLTLPIVAVGGASVYAAMKWESAFAGVEKTVDATEPQLAKLNDQLLEMSLRIPVSAEELANIAEAAGQLGIQTKNIAGFTEVMANMGVATNMSSTEAADQLARFANITQMPQSQFERLGSTVVDLGNKLATTELEIVNMGLRIAAAGNQVGLSEAEIMGFAAAVSSVGVRAEAGGTAISTAFLEANSAVMSGGAELQKWADVAGVTAGNFRKKWRANAGLAMIDFIEGLERLRKDNVDVKATLDELGLSGVRMRQVLLSAAGAGDLFRKSLGIGNKAWQENVALQKEADKRYGTFESRLQMLKNSIFAAGVVIGTELLPPLLEIAAFLSPKIRDFAKWFKGLSKPVKVAIMAFIGLLALLGPVLFLLGMVASGIGAALIIATSPITLIVLAIVALVAALVFLYIKFGWFRAGVNFVVSFLWKRITLFVSGAVIAFRWLASTISAVLQFGVNNAKAFAKGISAAWNWIKNAATNTKNWVVNAFNNLVDFFRKMPGRIAGFFSGMFDGLKNAFRGAINFIIRGWNSLELTLNIPDAIPGLPGSITIGTPDIPPMATGGTVTSPGMALVGERGPELLNLPQGASVIPLSGQNAQRIEVPVYLNGRQIALAVAGEVANAKARS